MRRLRVKFFFMQGLKKTIWRFYLLFFVASIILFALLLSQRANDIYRAEDTRQENFVVLIDNVLQSLFFTQEKLLDSIGHQILMLGESAASGAGVAILDNLLSDNDDIAGFLYTSLGGDVLFMSSNLNPSEVVEDESLITSAQNSFNYVLQSDKAVLGRTYFMPAINEWIIPIRKRVLDTDGEVVGIICASLRLGKAAHFFNEKIHSGAFHHLMLVRGSDWYVQYLSSDEIQPQIAYAHPAAKSSLSAIEQSIGMNLDVARFEKNPLLFMNTNNSRNTQMRGMMLYNERYELWTLSETNENYISGLWFKAVLAYLPVILIVHIVAFFLFYFLNRFEMNRQRELAFQANHDRLTKLPNRNFLSDQLQELISEGGRCAVFFVDMDNFKGVNDGFGHSYGDTVLKQIAERLRRVVGHGDVVARLGGDEFVILTKKTQLIELEYLASQLSSIVSTDFVIEQFCFTLGVSIGVAIYPKDGEDIESLIRASDIAMYEAKKQKNSIRYFEPQMQQSYLQRVLIEQALRGALSRHEISVVYQPKVNFAGKLLGVEALVRWHSEKFGPVSPEQFIPVAESCGLMTSIGQFIFETALCEMKDIQEALEVDFVINVNVSVRQLYSENFLLSISEAVKTFELESKNICLEITESVFIDDIEMVKNLLFSAKLQGLRIAMDDFGTGYSSLSQLSKLPIDELKIDKSFVDEITHSNEAKTMVQSIIAIGKNYGMSLIAEGIENTAQAQMLHSLGCDCFQGYHYSKPIDKNALKQFIVAQAS